MQPAIREKIRALLRARKQAGLRELRDVFAAGGGKESGGGGGGGSTEDKNTLFSEQFVRTLSIACEGEIKGLVNGLHSVYLNKTPLVASGAPTLTKLCEVDTGIKHIPLSTQSLAAMEGITIGSIVSGTGLVLGSKVIAINTTDDQFFFTVDQSPLSGGSGVTLTFTSPEYVNFHDFAFFYRYGSQTQEYIPGFDSIETPISPVPSAAIEVASTTPVTVSDTDADAIRVSIAVPALKKTVIKDSSMSVHGVRVEYTIDVRPYGGSWVTKVSDALDGKCDSQYVRSHRVALTGTGPWDVRIVRITPDSTNDNKIVDKIYWHSLSSIIDLKLNYPNTAMFGGSFAARQFSAIPEVILHLDLLKVKIPANYNPVAHTYATSGAGTTHGVWDGTFKVDWTDNPAWAYYDLVTNPRYGLGEFVTSDTPDVFQLYEIGQYCDVLVPDGYGGQERRFSINVFIQTREEAFRVLANMTAVFRGMTYWANGKVQFFQDKAEDPQLTFTPSTIVKGLFNYSGTSVRARHSVAYVGWNDPADFSDIKWEYVQDRAAVRDFGIREIQMVAFGCASRGQARRVGRLALFAEQEDTEAVSFEVATRGVVVYPGMVINVVDPSEAGIRLGGLIRAATTTTVTLDAPVAMTIGKQYTLLFTDPLGAPLTAVLTNSGATSATVAITTPLGSTHVPLVNSEWAISISDLVPQTFRVLSVAESEGNYKIGALAYNAGKYAAVENDLAFDNHPVTSLPRSTALVEPPTSLLAVQDFSIIEDKLTRHIVVSWVHSVNSYLLDYSIEYRQENSNWIAANNTANNSVSIAVLSRGIYTIRVRANNIYGRSSINVVTYCEIKEQIIDPGAVTGLELFEQGNDLVWEGRDVHVVWRHNSPDTAGGLGDTSQLKSPMLAKFVITVSDMQTGTPVFLRQTDSLDTQYIYTFENNFIDTLGIPTRSIRVEVSAVSKTGQLSAAAFADFTNPAPFIGSAPPFVDTALIRLNSAGGRLQLSYTKPNDSDFEGIVVFVKKGSGAFSILDISTGGHAPGSAPMTPYDRVANTGMLLYEGGDTNISVGLDPSTEYQLILAPYDAFGREHLNYYGPFSTLVDHRIDLTPPATPAGLVVTSRSEIDRDGSERVLLTAKFTPNNEDDLFSYGWVLREGSGTPSFSSGLLTTYDTTQIFTNIHGAIAARTAGSGFVQGLDGKVTIEWVVKSNTWYEVRVNALDTSANASAYTTLNTQTVVKSSRDTTPPSAPTSVTITSAVRAVFLEWVNNPADKDYAFTRVYRSTTAGFTPVYGTPYKSVSGNSFADQSCTIGTTYYYRLTNVDSSGNETAAASAEVSTTPGQVATSDITNFAVNLTKTFSATIALSNGSDGGSVATFTDNSPTAGKISWNAHTLFYRGAAYSIAAGNTLLGFVYWDSASPTAYIPSATNPALTNGQFMIATNVGGAHDLAWNALANALIGTAYIENLAVTNAKIFDLVVDKITSGSISTAVLNLTSGGTIKSNAAVSISSGAGFWIKDGEFRFGNPAGAHIKYTTAGGVELVGAITISALSTLAATATSSDFSAVTGATKPANNATLGATWGTNIGSRPAELTDGRITTAISATGVLLNTIAAAPSGTGLFIGSDNIGYYTGGQWTTYLASNGNFYFNSMSGAAFKWNGTNLAVYTSGSPTFYTTNTPFYVDTAGNFSLKQKLKFDATTGDLTISGTLSSVTGTFTSLSAGTGINAVSINTSTGIVAGDPSGHSCSMWNSGLYAQFQILTGSTPLVTLSSASGTAGSIQANTTALSTASSVTIQAGVSPYLEIGGIALTRTSITNLTLNNNLTVTGTVVTANGTAGAPAWSFSGDTNTGVYSATADTLNFATGGVSRGYFNSAGVLYLNGSLNGLNADFAIVECDNVTVGGTQVIGGRGSSVASANTISGGGAGYFDGSDTINKANLVSFVNALCTAYNANAAVNNALIARLVAHGLISA